METTSIGNGSGALLPAEILQTLNRDLAKEIVKPGHGLHSTATGATQSLDNVAKPIPQPQGPLPVTDVAAVLLSEIASSDISKLSRILEPTPDAGNAQILDSLLYRAVQEVAKGNAERAVGYLADYATRDPLRAEALPLQPELEAVRDKIDSMVSRMTIVAKMSAEEGLSRAEQSVTENTGRVSTWETSADVILKVAHRLFDAGGYANYSRTSELARLVTDTVPHAKGAHALAASASASASAAVLSNQAVPGVNVPYWAAFDLSLTQSADTTRSGAYRRNPATPAGDSVLQNLRDLKEVSAMALRQLWSRAPLLVIMLTWLFFGIWGGVAFSIASRIWPDGLFVAVGNFAFELWGIGFLAMVGFGFYSRVRYRQTR